MTSLRAVLLMTSYIHVFYCGQTNADCDATNLCSRYQSNCALLTEQAEQLNVQAKQLNVQAKQLNEQATQLTDRAKKLVENCSNTDPIVFNGDCNDILKNNSGAASGVYTIAVANRTMKVYCDMQTTGGGWTVFQRRQDGSVNFNRDWAKYSAGFGNPSGEFWLGLENLYTLTSNKMRYYVRVDLGDWEGNHTWGQWTHFDVSSASENYRLFVGFPTEEVQTSGDSLSYSNSMQFSTSDRDLDTSNGNCAETMLGGWWYRDCGEANLNGEYNNTKRDKGVNWGAWRGMKYSLKFTEMKLLPAA